MFILGSHTLGVLDAEHDVTTTNSPRWTINHDAIRKAVQVRRGMARMLAAI